MGNCCNQLDQQESSATTEYNRSEELNVIKRNYTGKIIGTSKVCFENTSPIKLQNTQGFLGKRSVKLHGCIIPGLDPRGETDKDCQDNYIYFIQDNAILCTLFDGHGKEGQKISDFCIDFVAKFFKKNIKDFAYNAKETLTRMLHKCDEKLRRSKVPDEMAGSTAVAIYITSTNIFSASLGDSRAIIATLSDTLIPVPIPTHRFYKKILIKRNLKPVSLTTDQKPNHEEEFTRIQAAGGCVEQVTDNFGKPIGPYRVWMKNKDYPGLAMSRSIGDRIAKRLGVIATPVCHDFQLYNTDQFIVIASDGIWDVMENIEVVNFVEKFKKGCGESTDLYPAKPDNSSIARMLCEEARFRWYGIIEAEDVMIDDISCIIVDFEDISGAMKTQVKERNVEAFRSMAIAPQHNHANTSINEDDNETKD
ncbi:hypothetical protein SteCoe_34409 [Stentor coeruleus]|uniref:PPM-type phosphatase domain-containing protein n=1 Tax=Stentor coeruleus TaxID=5963 RepID=A0A1R2AUM7_9CILI|nr:hypothetical protein SteCoe_34409 [Stentor coeruleus]